MFFGVTFIFKNIKLINFFSNSQTVVKQAVMKIVDENRIDAFLANCNCKFESRNSLLLKAFF